MVSVSREDAARLRDHWLRAVEDFNKTVAPSSEEAVRALVIDFFALG